MIFECIASERDSKLIDVLWQNCTPREQHQWRVMGTRCRTR